MAQTPIKLAAHSARREVLGQVTPRTDTERAPLGLAPL